MALGNIATYEDRPYVSLVESTAGSLTGLQYQLVALAGGDRTVQPNATAGAEIGVMWEKLQPLAADTEVSIRLLGKGGTTKIMQSGAIARGQRVCCDPANPTQVMALPDGNNGTTATIGVYRSLGRKPAGASSGAAGDIVEIIDQIEQVTITGSYALTETAGAIALALNANGPLNQNAAVTLTANGTLTITGAVAGMSGRLFVTQGGSGSYTLTLPSGSKVAGASTAGTVTLSTTVGKQDQLEWYYDGTNFWWTADLAYK